MKWLNAIGLILQFVSFWFAAPELLGAVDVEASGREGYDFFSTMVIIGWVSLAYVLYMIFFYKRLQRWLEKSVATALLEKLINNNEVRKNALIIGVVLFSLGFLVQLQLQLLVVVLSFLENR
jgi:MFS family permease